MDTYLGNKYPESRVAALHLIALDKDLPQDQRRKIAAEMIQHKLRDVAPCKAFVDQIKKDLNLKSDEEVEPEYARWYRDRASDNPVILVEIASGLAEVPAARRDWGCRALRLFYGNINLDDPRLHDQWRRESFYKELRALKKRSLEEIEKRIKLQEEEQRTKTDWQHLAQQDNERARNLIPAAEGGDLGALQELAKYRQCSNCTHVSHIERTNQGFCHHCDRMISGSQPMTWSHVIRLADMRHCWGRFPCLK